MKNAYTAFDLALRNIGFIVGGGGVAHHANRLELIDSLEFVLFLSLPEPFKGTVGTPTAVLDPGYTMSPNPAASGIATLRPLCFKITNFLSCMGQEELQSARASPNVSWRHPNGRLSGFIRVHDAEVLWYLGRNLD